MTSIIKTACRYSKILAMLFSICKSCLMWMRNGKNNIIDELIEKYSPDVSQYCKIKLHIDVVFCRLYYEITYSQYFIFEFENKNHTGRKKYIGEYEKNRLAQKTEGDGTGKKILRDKYMAYETFKKYYGRQIISAKDGIIDEALLTEFVKTNEKIILKADDKAEGKDVYLIKGESFAERLCEVKDKVNKLKNVVLEEFIEQNQELGKYHPSSVNTVRIVTLRTEEELIKLYGFLRMGAGNSIIDNASSGGIVAPIDIDTGIIRAPGFDENGGIYISHPDTGVQIVGEKLPDWDSLTGMLEELSLVLPNQRFIGWDFAYTKDSKWIMVEGNGRPQISAIQMCDRKGYGELYRNSFLKLKEK